MRKKVPYWLRCAKAALPLVGKSGSKQFMVGDVYVVPVRSFISEKVRRQGGNNVIEKLSVS